MVTHGDQSTEVHSMRVFGRVCVCVCVYDSLRLSAAVRWLSFARPPSAWRCAGPWPEPSV